MNLTDMQPKMETQSEIDQLRSLSKELIEENESLTKSLAQQFRSRSLKIMRKNNHIDSLKIENSKLKEMFSAVQDKNKELYSRVQELMEENKELKEQNAELISDNKKFINKANELSTTLADNLNFTVETMKERFSYTLKNSMKDFLQHYE